MKKLPFALIAVIAVIAVTTVTAAFAVVLGAIRARQVRPFEGKIVEYSSLNNFRPVEDDKPYVRGKIIAIDKQLVKVDPLFFELPGDLRADDPSEVGTVVW